jgi:hypothetical protein
MAIVTPPPEIAKRWDGALNARLRRAPLERFLESHALSCAAPGAAQDSDNIARAAIHVVTTYFDACTHLGLFSSSQRWAIAVATCALCETIASGIGDDSRWRIAALVSIARLLAPRGDLTESACFAATVVRAYERRNSTMMPVGEIESLKMAVREYRLDAPTWLAVASESIAKYMRSVDWPLISADKQDDRMRPLLTSPSKGVILRLVYSAI